MTLTAPWRFDSRSPSAPRIIGTCANSGSGSLQRIEDVDLPRRVVDVVVAADHVRDVHVEVVDHHAEVVGRHAVGAQQHEVVELGVGKRDRPLHQVVPADLAFLRGLEAAPAPGPCRDTSGRWRGRSAASRRARSAARAARRAPPWACSRGTRGRRRSAARRLPCSARGASSGRTAPRPSRCRATSCRRGSRRPTPASSARGRCPRRAG